MLDNRPELQYIRKIRNGNKRQYAHDYLDYFRGWRITEPDYHIYGISTMAAQAVRNMIHDLTAEKP